MKMKETCRATGLTERAIRLYLARRLITPGQRNGMLDFSAGDIRALKDIAVLRQHDFPLEQIAAMLSDASAIPDALRQRLDSSASAAAHEQAVHDALLRLSEARFDSVSALVAKLMEQTAAPELRFGQFDEARQPDAGTVQQALSRLDKRARRTKLLLAVFGTLAALIIAVAVFLSQTRVAGFLPLAPVTVLEQHPDDTITLSIGNPWAVDVLGTDVITVPCAAYGREDAEGDVVEQAVQLAVRLTNFDLLRLGISPLKSFRTRSDEVNAAWKRTILRAIFARPGIGDVQVWIREVSSLPPLFSPPALRIP